MRTKWKPPVRHILTASAPFIAVFQRTLRRLTKASSSFRLMGLSSTMRTLMGGTVPLSIPAGRVSWSKFFLLFLGLPTDGRGEEVRAGGVVAERDSGRGEPGPTGTEVVGGMPA